MTRAAMLPTGLGWRALAFYAALVGASFAAPYSNLFFLLIVFVGSLAVVNVWWTRANLAGASAEAFAVEPAPAGSGGELRVRMNAGTRRRYALSGVLDLGDAGLVRATAPSVEGARTVEGRLPPLPRGIHSVRRSWLESTYPLGVLRYRRAIEGPARVVVYPAPADLPAARSGSEMVAGLSGGMVSVAGTSQPSGLREYRDGDDPRAIHWRATARRGKPVVREWEGDAGAGLELVLDRRADDEPFERALSMIAAVALAAEEGKELLTLHTQGSTSTYGAGHRGWPELLECLAAAETLPADAPAPPPTSPTVLRLPLAERVSHEPAA